MTGKIYVSELASILVEKYGIDKRGAQGFIAAMVDVIRDGIARDKLVKVKGLGTFKVVEVEARESVNVNTGERVVIDSHSKLTFTPDAAMKDLVNKPFSQFETVVLNDGVTFDDMGQKEVEEPPVEEEAPVEEKAPEPQEPIAPIETIATIDAIETIETTTPEAPAPETPEVPEAPAPETPETPDDPEDPDTPEDPEPHSSLQWLWIPIILVLCGLCFGAGYYLGQQKKEPPVVPPTETSQSTHAESIVPEDTADIVIKEAPDAQTVQQTAQPEPQQPQPQPEAAAPQQPQAQQQPKAQAQQAQPKDNEDYKKYEAMDNRVRTGAYQIVGLDHVVKVKQGETLYRISRSALGPGMECYVEVYNGITKDTPLQVGQEIKIPKLKMKAAARKKLNR